MQQYIRHLIFERLGKGGKAELDQVALLIERLPWYEEEEFISRTLMQQIAFNSKFDDLDVMAILLSSLRTYHRPFVISIMD